MKPSIFATALALSLFAVSVQATPLNLEDCVKSAIKVGKTDGERQAALRFYKLFGSLALKNAQGADATYNFDPVPAGTKQYFLRLSSMSDPQYIYDQCKKNSELMTQTTFAFETGANLGRTQFWEELTNHYLAYRDSNLGSNAFSAKIGDSAFPTPEGSDHAYEIKYQVVAYAVKKNADPSEPTSTLSEDIFNHFNQMRGGAWGMNADLDLKSGFNLGSIGERKYNETKFGLMPSLPSEELHYLIPNNQ